MADVDKSSASAEVARSRFKEAVAFAEFVLLWFVAAVWSWLQELGVVMTRAERERERREKSVAREADKKARGADSGFKMRHFAIPIVLLFLTITLCLYVLRLLIYGPRM